MTFQMVTYLMKNSVAGSQNGCVPVEDQLQTLSDCLKQCCPITFSNIFTLHKIFATLPLSSSSCERSGSALKRLNNYLRCTQTEQRLTALSLIHMHYQTDISVDTACKLFIQASTHNRESKFTF